MTMSSSPLAPAKTLPLPDEKIGLFRLSPINRRRWNNFKANRRGYWSLWVFLILFVGSLFAEFIANDRPIIASYKGEILFPVLVDYPPEKFGDASFIDSIYRDKITQNEINAHGWMIWPPIRFSHSTIHMTPPTPFPSPPTWYLSDAECRPTAQVSGGSTCRDLEWNWLGTDSHGHDVLARLIYGFRLSMVFALILSSLSAIVGITAGAIQGYFGGWTDLLFQRFIEIWTAIPTLYLLLTVSSFFAPGFFILLGILLLFFWVYLVSVVRAEFLRGRNFEYVRAARALGLRDRTIMFKHILPNAMVATVTFLPFLLIHSISMLTALDFLGLGLPPGSPSLGELLAQGTESVNIQKPWIGFSAFFTITIMLSLLIFIGEAARDALDPRKTFR